MVKSIRKLNDEMPYIIFMNCPNISPDYLLDELLKEAKLSIFDFSDDFVELGYGKQSIELFRRNIAKYAKTADIVLTVNDSYKEEICVFVLRNTCNQKCDKL